MEMYRIFGKMSDRFIERSAMVSRATHVKKLRYMILCPRKKIISMGDFNYNLDPIQTKSSEIMKKKFWPKIQAGTIFKLNRGKKTHLSKIHNTTTTTDLVLIVPGIEIENVVVEELDVLRG